MRTIELEEAYKAGYDAGKSGPNVANCNFKFFRTKELMEEWSRGNKIAKETPQ